MLKIALASTLALLSLLLLIPAADRQAAPPRKPPAPARTPFNRAAFLRSAGAPPASEASVLNSLRITNPSARQAKSQPVTFARYFAAGEIPNYAEALLDGQPVLTQCDIKTRWGDSSVRHAVITFFLDLAPHSSVEVTFRDQNHGHNTAPLDAQAMLSPAYDLSAIMQLASAGDATRIDVRQLLAAGHFRYWLSGELCTRVIVDEISENPTFDAGFETVKSFHPIFVLTFYKDQPSVRVEFIGENAWISRRQDISYSLSLFTSPAPDAQPRYSKNDFKHVAGSRWRKTFWTAGDPVRLSIDHNLPYLISTRVLPSYDLSRTVSSSAIAAEVAQFEKGDRGEPGGACSFAAYQPMTGGRPDLGILPRWDVRYLYTFDQRLEDVVLACAGASAHFPIHFRESAARTTYSTLLGGGAALGLPVSVDARPAFCSRDGGIPFSSAADRATAVGPVTRGIFTPDIAHQPSMTFTAYLLSGDWFYLEELQYWAAWDLSSSTPGTCYYCAGSTSPSLPDNFSIIHNCGNIRALGWTWRNIAHAALLSPDDSLEKVYFIDKLFNNMVAQEGRFALSDGLASYFPDRAPIWNFGRQVLDNSADNPLCFVCIAPAANDPTQPEGWIEPSKVSWVISPWMVNIVLVNLAYIEDMGFPIGPLRRKAHLNLLGQIAHPDYNPYLTEAYRMPASKAKWSVFQSWAEVKDGFLDSRQNLDRFSGSTDSTFGYSFLALAASAGLTDIEDSGLSGLNAWQWMHDNIPNQNALNDNPMWAIVPRIPAAPGSVLNPSSWNRRFAGARRSPGSGARR